MDGWMDRYIDVGLLGVKRIVFTYKSKTKNQMCITKKNHQSVKNCQTTLIVVTLRWRIFSQDTCMGQIV